MSFKIIELGHCLVVRVTHDINPFLAVELVIPLAAVRWGLPDASWWLKSTDRDRVGRRIVQAQTKTVSDDKTWWIFPWLYLWLVWLFLSRSSTRREFIRQAHDYSGNAAPDLAELRGQSTVCYLSRWYGSRFTRWSCLIIQLWEPKSCFFALWSLIVLGCALEHLTLLKAQIRSVGKPTAWADCELCLRDTEVNSDLHWLSMILWNRPVGPGPSWDEKLRYGSRRRWAVIGKQIETTCTCMPKLHSNVSLSLSLSLSLSPPSIW